MHHSRRPYALKCSQLWSRRTTSGPRDLNTPRSYAATGNGPEQDQNLSLDTMSTTQPLTTSTGAGLTTAPAPSAPPMASSALPRPYSGPPAGITKKQKLADARRLLEANGETTLKISGLKSQMRARLSATLQMPRAAEDSQYTTTHIEAMPAALMRPWLLAMGWTRAEASPDSQPVFETNSNKVLGKLYALSKTGVSIVASKLHCPKSAPKATTMIAAVAPARATMYTRPDESEWVSIVTNVATLSEVR